MKKFIKSCATLGLSLMMCSQVFGATGKIINNKTYVPVRGVFEELGFTVSYDNATATATISNDEYTIKVPKNKDYFEVNGKSIKPDSPQKIVDGSLYLPLRAIGDSIGANTSWDNNTKTASVSYNNKLAKIDCSNHTTKPNNENNVQNKEKTNPPKTVKENIKMKNGDTITKNFDEDIDLEISVGDEDKVKIEKISNSQYKITALKSDSCVGIYVWSKSNDLTNILYLEIEPKISLLDTQLPKEITAYNWFDEIKNKCIIKDIQYKIEQKNNNTMNIYFYFNGTKTYDKEGNNANGMCTINWKLYDDDNNVVDSGTIYTNDLTVGESFKNENVTCYNLPYEGSYYLQLYDDK